MRRVIIESPFAGDTERNLGYARACLRDCLLRGEAPLASHLLYPQALDDDIAHERSLGMAAGWVWFAAAEAMVVYTDFGISEGMRRGIERAKSEALAIEYRCLDLDSELSEEISQ